MIAYQICGGYSGKCSCYGSIGAVIGRGTKPFTGIRLYFSSKALDKDLAKDNLTYSHCYNSMSPSSNLFKEAEKPDKVWKSLELARRLGFGEYLPTNTKAMYDGYIDFPPHVPFIIVVAVTGFFRWYDNHPSLLKSYEFITAALEKRWKKKAKEWEKRNGVSYSNYRPGDVFGKPLPPALVPAFLAANTTAINEQGKLIPHSHSTHSVVPSTAFSLNGMTAFSTWESRKGHLEPMEDEFKREGTLSYQYRDIFFAGAPSMFSFQGGSFYHVDTRMMITQSLVYSFIPRHYIEDATHLRYANEQLINVEKLCAFIERCNYGGERICFPT